MKLIVRILTIVSSVIILVMGLIHSTRILEIKENYLKGEAVVVSELKSNNTVDVMYIVGTLENSYTKEKICDIENVPKIGTVLVAYINPNNYEDIIYEDMLEDKGSSYLKLSVVLFTLFLVTFLFNKDNNEEDDTEALLEEVMNYDEDTENRID